MEQLMNLPEEDYKKLNNANLPNNDTKTDEKTWEARGKATAQEFVKSSTNAINLLLGKE